MANEPPIIIPAPASASAPSATIIFLHGLGDDAYGWTGTPLSTSITHALPPASLTAPLIATDADARLVADLVTQFHSANKLPHVRWILPNAPHNRDLMAQAWCRPRYNLLLEMPKGDGGTEDDEAKDDEDGMLKSVEYICDFIDKEVELGVPPERIVVGGFSQGCAIALLVGLMSRYRGQLAGVVGMSGNLPLQGKLGTIMKQRKEGERNVTRFFLAHGSKDQFVPRRYFTTYVDKMKGWDGDNVDARLYEGMGHSTTGEEVRDLCAWLEKIVPA